MLTTFSIIEDLNPKPGPVGTIFERGVCMHPEHTHRPTSDGFIICDTFAFYWAA